VAHCPTSNLKLASGIPPMSEIQARGLNFGLGTDGAASNNRLDLFHEMRHAALLAKGRSENAEALDAHSTLAAATIGGARALGLDARIGSLLPGKSADLCAVRLDDWLMQPCFDPASHLVYAAGREQVSHTWVAGELVMKNGEPLQIDISELLDITGLWHTRLTS
jgi:5-methylthioadenosine/S-adenosylhomocysteine deaminase